MKDLAILKQYVASSRPLSPAWANPLWEDFPDEDLDDEEPPLDADIDDLARGGK